MWNTFFQNGILFFMAYLLKYAQLTCTVAHEFSLHLKNLLEYRVEFKVTYIFYCILVELVIDNKNNSFFLTLSIKNSFILDGE